MNIIICIKMYKYIPNIVWDILNNYVLHSMLKNTGQCIFLCANSGNPNLNSNLCILNTYLVDVENLLQHSSIETIVTDSVNDFCFATTVKLMKLFQLLNWSLFLCQLISIAYGIYHLHLPYNKKKLLVLNLDYEMPTLHFSRASILKNRPQRHYIRMFKLKQNNATQYYKNGRYSRK